MLTNTLALAILVSTAALLNARWEYRRRGKLTLFGVFLLCAMLFVFLFLLGFALNDWSTWCLAALLVVAISLHLLVLVEEEHLRRVFGEKYVAFCREIPRYAGK